MLAKILGSEASLPGLKFWVCFILENELGQVF